MQKPTWVSPLQLTSEHHSHNPSVIRAFPPHITQTPVQPTGKLIYRDWIYKMIKKPRISLHYIELVTEAKYTFLSLEDESFSSPPPFWCKNDMLKWNDTILFQTDFQIIASQRDFWSIYFIILLCLQRWQPRISVSEYKALDRQADLCLQDWAKERGGERTTETEWKGTNHSSIY